LEDALVEPGKTVIKVIGVGGGGQNAIKRMMECNVSGVEFIAVNTDIQALNACPAPRKIAIGKQVTRGLGAGGKPAVGEQAAMEDRDVIGKAVENAHMVFVCAGMGGGTGTGAAPVIAQVARERGILTIGVVTRPFDFELGNKMQLADEGIGKMREAVDSILIIPNENLLKVIDNKTSVKQAFRIADDVLRQGVQGIAEVITIRGEINIDFADVESTMKNQGDALMGIGYGTGENRAAQAAAMAIDNPMLEETKINGARKILVNVTGSEELTMSEYRDAVNYITQNADPDAEVIPGLAENNELGDQIMVTVIATGFQSGSVHVNNGISKEAPRKKPELIDSSEWTSIIGDKEKKVYLPNRNGFIDDIDIPAALRTDGRDEWGILSKEA
jgi:cell division protein FtsZ